MNKATVIAQIGGDFRPRAFIIDVASIPGGIRVNDYESEEHIITQILEQLGREEDPELAVHFVFEGALVPIYLFPGS